MLFLFFAKFWETLPGQKLYVFTKLSGKWIQESSCLCLLIAQIEVCSTTNITFNVNSRSWINSICTGHSVLTELPYYHSNKLICVTFCFIANYFSCFKCQCNIVQPFVWVNSQFFSPWNIKYYLVKSKYWVYVAFMKLNF